MITKITTISMEEKRSGADLEESYGGNMTFLQKMGEKLYVLESDGRIQMFFINHGGRRFLVVLVGRGRLQWHWHRF